VRKLSGFSFTISENRQAFEANFTQHEIVQ